MCGIAGFWQGQTQSLEVSRRIGEAMASQIASRGPDDSDVWTDPNAGMTLAHRRLSIIDLTSAGHQPMFSPSGRFVITFNGEIYNHLELRAELEQFSIPWRGHSDTEILLAGFEVWNIEETLRRCIGMFAMGVWDRFEKTLTLARDRMGEKPLYYGWQGRSFLFASQPKAFRAHPAFEGRIDRESVALFLRHSFVPAPRSIYDGIRKLPPATILKVPLGDAATHGTTPEPQPYWSLAEAATRGVRNPFSGSESEASDALERLMSSAVGLQMIADVPLGAFLSGGIDSSTIVALMQAQSSRPVKTFTIGFHEAEYNEAETARTVARHLGTDHTELYVTPDAAKEVIPLLPDLYDEPFADSTQIPNFLVSRLARREVTVALSGDAGDELFGGYNRYFQAQSIWRRSAWLPPAFRRTVGQMIRVVPASVWNGIGHAVRPVMANRRRDWLLAGRALTAADLIAADSPEELYGYLMSDWKRPEEAVIGTSRRPADFVEIGRRWPRSTRFIDLMMYFDAVHYLPDGILVKVDRAAMGVSLETRVPLLDHRIVEFAWSLPHSMKVRHGKGKWILRQVLARHVPPQLFEGPKRGFTLPVGTWLRGPLRDWAESLLSEDRLQREGFFRSAPIRDRWRQHVDGRRDYSTQVWAVLMFQAWLERQSQSRPAAVA